MMETTNLNPDIQKFLYVFNEMIKHTPPDSSVETGRDAYETFAAIHSGPPISMRRIEDLTITARDGKTDIPIRIYYPHLDGERLPLLVYFHGGGWQRGSINSHDSICRHLAVTADCGVLSVGWRLAPEHRFPAGNLDCLDAYLWARHHASDLGFDPDHIGISGDSAGGNMAASILLRLRDMDDVMPVFQALFYPSLDLTCEMPSYDTFKDGFFLTTERVRYYVDHYINSPDEIMNPYVSPLKSNSFQGFPPALIVTAEFDPLRDEGECYAQKLGDAGIAATHIRADGMIHAFLHMTKTAPAVRDFFNHIGPIIGRGIRA